jgi:hypothetical protein
MRVDWAIPCRYVEVQPPGGATIVGAGADVVPVPEVPVAVQMLFAVRYVGAPDELDGQTTHPVATRVFDSRGEQMGEETGDATVEIEGIIVPDYVAELIVPSSVVIDAREFGTYSVEFAIDGHSRRVPIHIVERPR